MGTADSNVGSGTTTSQTEGPVTDPMVIDLTDDQHRVTPRLGPGSAAAALAFEGAVGRVNTRPDSLTTPSAQLSLSLPEQVRPVPEPGSAPAPVPQKSLRSSRRADWLGRFGVQPLLLAGDVLAVLLGAAALRAADAQVGRVNVLFGALLIMLFSWAQLYRSRLSMSLLDDLPTLLGRWLAAVAITALVQSAFTQLRWDLDLVKWNVVAAAGVTLVLLVIFRAISYEVVRQLRRKRRVMHRTLVLGAGRVGAQVSEILLDHPEYGLHPIGFLDSDPWLGPKELPLPILGGTDGLFHVLIDHDVNNVVVAFGSMRESALVDVIRTCDRLDTEIFMVPRLFELHQVGHEMDAVWGMPLVRLRRAARRSRGWRVKRVFDIAVSALALVILSPILLIAAIAVRLEGGPGIIFRQERVGVDGRRFQVMKFRSLKPVDETESQTNWNIALDDRLGPVGKFLRKSSIDELPQLINILKGEMSLVGPRPERPHFVDQFCEAYPRYVARHRVPSGLTGWAQVHGLRGDTSIADRARFDNYYIENWSLWLDVKIMLRTVGSVVRGDGG